MNDRRRNRCPSLRVLFGLLFFVVAFVGRPQRSGGAPKPSERERTFASSVVARVGRLEISSAYLRVRYEGLSQSEKAELGETPALALRHLLGSVLVPEARLAAAAQGSHPTEGILADSVRQSIWHDASSMSPSRAEVRAYYRHNSRLFRRPGAHRLARILLRSRRSAERLLQEYQTPQSRPWRVMARAESLDEATRMRGGDLGFVFANGHTHRPQVRVDPDLFAAADKLGGNGVVPYPVKESSYYGVVRRTESRPERVTPLGLVRETIENLLREQRAAENLEELLTQLRTSRLNEYEPMNLRKLPRAVGGKGQLRADWGSSTAATRPAPLNSRWRTPPHSSLLGLR